MDSKQKAQKTETKIEHIESALSRAELFIEKNQKIISGVVIGILLVVGAAFAFHRFYRVPLNEEAAAQMFHAENFFAADSMKLALNGDGNNLGFLDIIDQYGSTDAGNLAHYYAGIAYLNLGEYENAIKQLKKFSSRDALISNIAIGAIGDACAELGNNSDAIKYYLKAAKNRENNQTTPIYLFRAGLLLEETGDYAKALEIYTRLEKDYPASTEGSQAEKYITRVKIKGNLP
jgi:tetratricopeptide (TPR) repeat protein